MRSLKLTIFICVATASSLHAQAPDTSANATAYLDSSARELVRMARERRRVADLSVTGYKVLSKERISVGLRGLRRDRLLYRREVAGRIEWHRNGPGKIEVLGAREAIPVAIKNVQLPSDLGSFMPHLAFDPADTRMLVGWADNDFVRHPLAADAERYYRYRTGATTTIQLPGAKSIRLIELEIIPRTSDPRNVSGSFWLDEETHAPVQAAFRLARDIDVVRDLGDASDEDDMKKMPGFIKPLTMSVDYLTIEYGLYDLKWWMPRSVLFEGTFRAGFLRTPMQYERTYSQYQIEASPTPITAPVAEVLQQDSAKRAATDSCDDNRVSIQVRIGGSKPDTTNARGDSVLVMRCRNWQVTMAADTAALLNSAELPADVFATGEELVTEGELRELQHRIEKLGGGPPMLPNPITDFSLLSVGQMRYNRVEGLSVGAHGELDYGALRGTAAARIGVADLEPNFELAVEKPGQDHDLRLAGYRRLNAFDPTARPFSIGSSLSALLFGQDDADYYRSMGVELTAEPSTAHARWYSLRLFAQHEKAAQKATDFSLRHSLNGDYLFRPNLQATPGDEFGSELTLRWSHGLDPDGLRLGAELYGHGAVGSNDFGRGALTLRAGFPLPGALSGALEAASGLTSTRAPLQHLWYLGGANSLRGYPGATLSGETFWRGRGEVGYGLPAVKIVAFSDVGWAGARANYKTAKPLVSAGAGVSLLDGILRFDIARGLRAPKGWRATLYFDAAL